MPLPSSVTLVPIVASAVVDDKGIVGCGVARAAIAAATAPDASSRPAPQVVVVQMHSLLWGVPFGAWQAWTVESVPVVGNARALLRSSLRICAGVSDGLTESMSAAVPATSGDEKLVPSEVLKLSL